jgi:thiaminase (transcriptional activator TenA)
MSTIPSPKTAFSALLRQETDSLFQAIYEHPFVQGIANGQLPSASLIHYVQQDTQYLNTYCRVYALALAKSTTNEQMRLFHSRIGLLLEGELPPHENLCRVAGVQREQIVRDTTELAPSAHHYQTHMLSVAGSGTLAEIVAVVLPCHWVYVDIAKRMVNELELTPSHPFYDWINFYASGFMRSGLTELTQLLDDLSSVESTCTKSLIRSAFQSSCRLEYEFFDMAYKRETWFPEVTAESN